MRAVIVVLGKDSVGILAAVSQKCAQYNANIIDVSQTVMKSIFSMVMIVDIDSLNLDLSEFSKAMKDFGHQSCLEINVMHEDIFNSMHRI